MIPSAHSNKLGVMEQTKKEPLKKTNQLGLFILYFLLLLFGGFIGFNLDQHK